jgi:hypothetical protein
MNREGEKVEEVRGRGSFFLKNLFDFFALAVNSSFLFCITE